MLKENYTVEEMLDNLTADIKKTNEDLTLENQKRKELMREKPFRERTFELGVTIDFFLKSYFDEHDINSYHLLNLLEYVAKRLKEQ